MFGQARWRGCLSHQTGSPQLRHRALKAELGQSGVAGENRAPKAWLTSVWMRCPWSSCAAVILVSRTQELPRLPLQSCAWSQSGAAPPERRASPHHTRRPGGWVVLVPGSDMKLLLHGMAVASLAASLLVSSPPISRRVTRLRLMTLTLQCCQWW